MMELLLLIGTAFYFMLPIYFSNMAPVLCRKIPFLNYPVDFNKKYRDKPIFGKNKTYRGLFFATLFGVIVAFIQHILWGAGFFRSASLIDYSGWLVVGLLMGFGAIFTDLIKSFFKRRLNIKPGERFIPFDQLDFVVGGLLFVFIVFIPPWQVIVAALIISPLLHMLTNHVSFFLKMREGKW